MISPVLPKTVRRVHVPPVKCQGIKTELVPFVAANIKWDGLGRWIEPFLGSGVVAFNLAPKSAKLSDTNKHIINLYRAIQEGHVTEGVVRERLDEMGGLLRKQGEDYFYSVRDRFNGSADPLDLLFLNRSCFNGVMRFNSKGRYNVPFGKQPDRFRKAYITKIVNQIQWLRRVLRENQWEIECRDWKKCLAEAQPADFVYLDPPYIGRHTDYFNQWDMNDAIELAQVCHALPCGYALSMWKENKYRENEYLTAWWKNDEMRTFTHFYHVGPKESLRNEMTEALAIKRGYAAPEDFWGRMAPSNKRCTDVQLSLFEDIEDSDRLP
jgi:DNA adenine methylase